jgi:hypothetical protein
MTKKTGFIDLSSPPGRLRTVQIKGNSSKVKDRLGQKKRVSTRRLDAEMNVSRSSAHRILCENLGYYPYKKVKRPKLTDLQKTKGASLKIGCCITTPKITQRGGFLLTKNILI